MQSWIADRIGLRSGDKVSAQLRKLSARPEKEIPPEIRAWIKKFKGSCLDTEIVP